MSCQNKASHISIHNSLLTLAEVATRTSFMNEDPIENTIKFSSETCKTKTSNLDPPTCFLNEIKKSSITCDDQCVKSEEICSEKKSKNSTSCLNPFKNSSNKVIVKRKKSFPETLMDILSSNEDTITWLPRGNAFAIVDKENLTNNVLPLYFKHIQYRSFVTRLYRWGFKRFIKGQGDCKIFYHKFFLRDSPSLCKMIYIQGEAKSNNEVLNEESNAKHPQNEKEKVSSAKVLFRKTMEVNSNIHPQDLQRNILTTNNNNLVSLESRNSSLYVDKLLHGYFNRKMSQIRSHYFPKIYYNSQA